MLRRPHPAFSERPLSGLIRSACPAGGEDAGTGRTNVDNVICFPCEEHVEKFGRRGASVPRWVNPLEGEGAGAEITREL